MKNTFCLSLEKPVSSLCDSQRFRRSGTTPGLSESFLRACAAVGAGTIETMRFTDRFHGGLKCGSAFSETGTRPAGKYGAAHADEIRLLFAEARAD